MELIRFQETHTGLINTYTLSEEQLRFTGHPAYSVPLCREEPNRHAVLGMDDNRLVTYFVLHEQEGVHPFSDNPNAILLRTLSTDHQNLGKGYGKAALQQLPDFVQMQFPHVNEIVLAVNETNEFARKLYEKCGYQDTGRRVMGSKGILIVMSYALEMKG
ncbi:Acetyltransferase (GNAT) family protein [Terribacillus halophilus]|uniref:Acetyltransferase (GNAT) family protein n=1 Tax=Terribacillus halophilus TaxID=361279 RepID=A0A1G6QP96_9BACI|nr:GNAT family protein [Terribacillus halophilus]SDC94148.1 Acetyltransferase (GNAT) family protein [Terribacillus halophilus]